MTRVEPGWYQDPAGRFVHRYYDGTRWTEHVTAAGGVRFVDPPLYRCDAASGGGRPAPGLVTSGIGALLVMVSLLGVDFMELDHDFGYAARLGDMRGNEMAAALDLYAGPGHVVGLLVVVGAVCAVLLLPALRRRNGETRLAVVMVGICGTFGWWHVVALSSYAAGIKPGSDESTTYSPTSGAWLGVLGWLVITAALVRAGRSEAAR